jgi:predicted MFS family arabinose efflux permease
MEAITEAASPARGPSSITRGMTLLLAAACGLVIANIYYVQPLAGPIARALGLPTSATGIMVTLTQIGYGLGLILLVPLCDLLENRRIIVVMVAATAVALAIAGFAPSALLFLTASLAIGLSSTAVQMLVPFAASMAPEEHRGRVVGQVVGGLMLGIMMARPLASFIAGMSSWHTVFLIGAAVMVIVATTLGALLPRRVPETKLTYFELLVSMAMLMATQPVLRTRATYQFLLFASFSLFWTVSPLLLAGAPFNLSQHGIGWFALAGVTGALASPVAGYLADKGLGRAATMVGILAVVVGYAVTLIPLGGSTTALVVLVLAAVLIDFGLTLNVVIGQRAIYGLAPELRSRLNGLFGGSTFCGGAIGSAVGGWAFAHGGWQWAAVLGAAFPMIALAYFVLQRLKGKADKCGRKFRLIRQDTESDGTAMNR